MNNFNSENSTMAKIFTPLPLKKRENNFQPHLWRQPAKQKQRN